MHLLRPQKSSRKSSQVKSSQVKSNQGDEVTEGDENVSMQRAEGGSGSTGGIKKKKSKRRSRIEKSQSPRSSGKMVNDRAGQRGMRVRYCPHGT